MKRTLTLRDLFWLVLVVAMGLGWWLDHRKAPGRIDDWKDVTGGVQVIPVRRLTHAH